ncbi:MAG: DUF4351 domain-containing protein [Methylobacter sp.]|nr:DUF4351 domain-containing protein [Methylobacter sp.]MDP2099620.1 DUF4351 domain-containing protein [Methylobacter sp.]MDP2429816.1 DUF4351 domain-containing protein [Methylobacter sp.]MDP3055536.1 DUF4351 domain-containing protein [Methylobacter sp.]MDP3361342.1 DUF4351 domain-containing protein [Methylobacter sp.]
MGDKDIISKHILKRLLLDMARYLCQLDIVDAELLNTEQQRIEDRRADLVARVEPTQGAPFILHIEVQNGNDSTMVNRMLRYLADIQHSHPGLPVHQCLLYIGRKRLTMTDGQTGAQLHYRYQLVDMRTVDYRHLYNSDDPNALVLSILCDFQGKSSNKVVRHILTKLQTLTGDNEKQRREYIQMLEILADNRDLNIDIQEAYDMLQIRLERLPSYQKGMERGEKLGIERGEKLGIERGEKLGIERGEKLGIERGEKLGIERGLADEARLLLKRVLTRRFGDITSTLEENIGQASRKQIEQWFDRALEAESLDEIFKSG